MVPAVGNLLALQTGLGLCDHEAQRVDQGNTKPIILFWGAAARAGKLSLHSTCYHVLMEEGQEGGRERQIREELGERMIAAAVSRKQLIDEMKNFQIRCLTADSYATLPVIQILLP